VLFVSTLPGSIVHFLLTGLDLLFFLFFTEPSNGPFTHSLGMQINILLFSRYLVFGLLVICNAILCSVAVWNFSYAQSVGQNVQVDAFLTFLGAFALVFIFAIIVIEILRKNAVTGRLWFEVLWVGIFWIMELSGAAAFSALAPDLVCGAQSALVSNVTCSSTHVLLAFSWLSTVIFLVYLVCLVCAAIIRHKRDPQIWHAEVVEFCQSNARYGLRSAPTSPILPRFHTTEAIAVISSQPRQPPPNTVYAFRSGLDPGYQIEHFRPLSPAAGRPVPAAALQHVPQTTGAVPEQLSAAVPVYPQLLRSLLMSQESSQIHPPVPPLGNWPLPNAVDQPLHIKKPTPVTFHFPARVDPASKTVQPSNPSHRSRPPGSRTSSNEIRRPPPLDLARISTFRTNTATYGV